jgi:GNAT superfamily N-acetyltransferase
LVINPGSRARTRIRFGTSEREVSASTLKTFLANAITSTELVLIEQEVPSDADWRLIYVPEPQRLDEFRSSPALMEILLSQRAACVADDQTPAWLLAVLKEQGQRLWTATGADFAAAESSTAMLREIRSVIDEDYESLETALEPQWRWFAGRLLQQIEEQARELQTALDKFHGQRKVAEQTLEQYRRNWMGGIHNILDDWFQGKTSGPTFTALVDHPKKCTSDAFMQSLGLNSLWPKLSDMLTDRMAEFIPGLSGLATRMELHRIALGDARAHWVPRSLNSVIDQALTDRKLLSELTEKKKGLVESLTRKKSLEADERRSHLQRAAKAVMQIIETGFADWSESLMRELRAGIELQLIAALANRGLPDPEGIVAAQRGLEQVKQVMVSPEGGASSEAAHVEELLRSLTNRRWLTRHVPPARAS